MKTVTVRLTTAKKAAALFCFLLLCALLLWFPSAVKSGVARGLAVCGNVLVPTLLPFMAMAFFLVESGLADVVGRRLGRVTTALFGLPGCTAAGICLAFVGGYPAGAAACAKLVERGQLSPEEARRMMRFCVVAGPAFVVGTVGAELLGSQLHGFLLLAAQWAAALCIGVIGGRGHRNVRSSPPLSSLPKPLASAAAVAVGDAARAMLTVCGFVTVTTGFLSVLDALGSPPLVNDVAAVLSEVSVGCLAVAPNVLFLAACIGFGGLSVFGQIAALFRIPLLTGDFFAARITHAALAAVFSWGLFRLVPLPVATASVTYARVVPFSCGFTGSAALLATLAVAVLSLPQKGT